MTLSKPDSYGRLIAEGVTENAIFSVFHNLIAQRKSEGLSKAEVAERMGIDRAAVTKLTNAPTNMKISTMAGMANALDSDILFFLVDRTDRSRLFSSIGVHVMQSYFQNMSVVSRLPFADTASAATHMTPTYSLFQNNAKLSGI